MYAFAWAGVGPQRSASSTPRCARVWRRREVREAALGWRSENSISPAAAALHPALGCRRSPSRFSRRQSPSRFSRRRSPSRFSRRRSPSRSPSRPVAGARHLSFLASDSPVAGEGEVEGNSPDTKKQARHRRVGLAKVKLKELILSKLQGSMAHLLAVPIGRIVLQDSS
uniref:Uncharacterized protein n=1 Tax=Oryza meridionalis TaxID=40149 RepID=A0A0E0ELL5_9ORYZ